MENLLSQTPSAQWGRLIALDMLWQARTIAINSDRTIWDFAIELESLLHAGATLADLRWLVAQGFACHAEEITKAQHTTRRFRPIKSLMIPRGTCFVLADFERSAVVESIYLSMLAANDVVRSRISRGEIGPAVFASAEHPERTAGLRPPTVPGPALVSDRQSREQQAPPGRPAPSVRTRSQLPVWNPGAHELRLGSRLLKRFTRPAKSQEIILAAFQEEGWPELIDDPLPQDPSQDPKRRLHYTIHHLNRGQRPHLILFYVNGGGQSVHWRLASVRRESGARRARNRR
ncbi:MAG TPA: hypothetical protein VGM05_15780 [Planctomycetaceae bacterium]|jgi:hypothetical protein